MFNYGRSGLHVKWLLYNLVDAIAFSLAALFLLAARVDNYFVLFYKLDNKRILHAAVQCDASE